MYLACGLVEEQLLEIESRLEGDDEVGFLDPYLKGSSIAETTVRVAVVLAFQPRVKPAVKLLYACDLRSIERAEELLASRSDKALDLPLEMESFPFSWKC